MLAVPLHEASLKARAGGPGDEPEDVAAGVWGGHVPLRLVAGDPVPDADARGAGARTDVAPSGGAGASAAGRALGRVPPMTQPRPSAPWSCSSPTPSGAGWWARSSRRFEAKGLTIVAMELRTIDAAKADEHYAEHVERDFYPPLRAFVTSGPLVAMVLEGDEAIEVVRALNGATDGRKAAPGTIRGDLSLSNRENLVHGSDSPESAEREIKIWFPGL